MNIDMDGVHVTLSLSSWSVLLLPLQWRSLNQSELWLKSQCLSLTDLMWVLTKQTCLVFGWCVRRDCYSLLCVHSSGDSSGSDAWWEHHVGSSLQLPQLSGCLSQQHHRLRHVGPVCLHPVHTQNSFQRKLLPGPRYLDLKRLRSHSRILTETCSESEVLLYMDDLFTVIYFSSLQRTTVMAVMLMTMLLSDVSPKNSGNQICPCSGSQGPLSLKPGS